METKHVRTSGAYIMYKGLFPFQVGPTRKGDKLGVVRLGGHREDGESAQDTAIREVFEESSMEIELVNSPITFFKREWNDTAIKIRSSEDIAPILLKGTDPTASTAMYLAYSNTAPVPSSETNGLLLLSREEISLICTQKITLEKFIAQGGKASLSRKINFGLPLEPFPQLLFLAELFEKEASLLDQVISVP
ncbi:NUDIX hydrolase [Mesobacillus subterraneus]|uniref:NUDIX hydrolase n=1 Tax=Mesobacillus subterraneus TaxID=285983 RepID=UPI001CFEC3B7|nr:NUDIX hydrolase [Mesobacillus subterraneus]WLR57483.1 NUDIX hydrolase [Mesobacillus subterraneus]